MLVSHEFMSLSECVLCNIEEHFLELKEIYDGSFEFDFSFHFLKLPCAFLVNLINKVFEFFDFSVSQQFIDLIYM